MAKHQHQYVAVGAPSTQVIGDEMVTYQRMECTGCPDAYNAITARHKIKPSSN